MPRLSYLIEYICDEKPGNKLKKKKKRNTWAYIIYVKPQGIGKPRHTNKNEGI